MMWGRSAKWFLLLFFVPSLPFARDAREGRRYYITETQLLSIEESVGNLEESRQNWESQARSLNSQLRADREKYGELQASWNRLESSLSLALERKETENRNLLEEKNRAELDREKTKNQRNAALLAALLPWLLFLAVFLGIKLFRR